MMRWLNNGNLDLIDELMAQDSSSTRFFSGLADDREGTKQFFAMMHNAFDGFRMDIEDMGAEGDRVVARLTMKGTHKGEFMGLSGTDRTFNVSTIDIVRFADGKAVEHWRVTDAMSMMDQLGAGTAMA